MRLFFPLCLLAIGASASSATIKTQANEHDHDQQKRHVGELRSLQQTVVVQPNPAHQSPYSAKLIQQTGRAYFDQSADLDGQQIAQGFYDYPKSLSTDYQSIGTGVAGDFVDASVSVAPAVPLARNLEGPAVRYISGEVRHPVEVPVPNPVPAYAERNYRVNVDQPTPLSVTQPFVVSYRIPASVLHPVSHQRVLNIPEGYAGSFGHQRDYAVSSGVSYNQQTVTDQQTVLDQLSIVDQQQAVVDHEQAVVDQQVVLDPQKIHFFENPSDPLTIDGSPSLDQRINGPSQLYNVAEQESPTEASSVQDVFRNAYKTVGPTQHVKKPVQLPKDSSDSEDTGYHYDKPAIEFNF